MNKYAMIPINIKEDDEGRIHVRRVLISYRNTATTPSVLLENCNMILYAGTKLIEVDPYFKDETKSHQYKFDDFGYTLIEVNNENTELYESEKRIYDKRMYHSFEPYAAEAILFEAKTDKSAIKKFNERVEPRD